MLISGFGEDKGINRNPSISRDNGREKSDPKNRKSSETEDMFLPGVNESVSDNKGKSVKLNFVHINDFHGYVEELDKPDSDGVVGGISRLSSEIKETKSENPEGTITLDGGDLYDGGFYSKVTNGEAVSKPYHAMGFDAIVIGNHDVLWGLDTYAEIARTVGTDFLGANVIDKSPEKSLSFLKPYKVIERLGMKIGVIGLAAPETTNCMKKKDLLEIADPVETAKNYVEKLKNEEHVDMIVVLSHLGSQDKELADKVKGIDVIIASHTHEKTEKPEKIGDTLIVQAGSDGKYVGNLSIEINPESKKRVAYSEKLIPITEDIKPDPEIEKIMSPYMEKFGAIKNKIVGHTAGELELLRDKTNKLANLFVDAHRKDSDIALANHWSIRKGLNKGDIKHGDLFQMFPFDNELLQINASGRNIIEFIESGLIRVKDGERANNLMASGFSYTFKPDAKDGNKIVNITMGEKTYTKEQFAKKIFKISLDDYNVKDPSFKDCEVIKKYGKVFDIIKEYINIHSPLGELDGECRSKAI